VVFIAGADVEHEIRGCVVISDSFPPEPKKSVSNLVVVVVLAGVFV
jgi:hypothetical protein